MEQCVRTAILRQPRKKKKSVEKSQEEIEDILFLEEENPVCGWIVCVKVREEAKITGSWTERIFVGRADDMDIQILGDNKIARRNHAVIVFDAKKRGEHDFTGRHNGLVYLNGEAVYLPQPLSAYDVIEMGRAHSFCSFLRGALYVGGR